MYRKQTSILVFLIVAIFMVNVTFGDDFLNASRTLGEKLQSGSVVYQSTYKHKAKPIFDGSGFDQFIQHGITSESEWITYNTDIYAYFKGNQLRFDVHQDEVPGFYPEIQQTFLYDGEKVTFQDHAKKNVLTIKPEPYRKDPLGILYVPPKTLGYDIDGVIGLVRQVKDEQGNIASISLSSEDNKTYVTGFFPESVVTLAEIEWDADHPGIFKKCSYLNPHYGEIIEITTNAISEINGIPYPSNVSIKKWFAPSLGVIDEATLGSEQNISIVSVEFNSDTVSDELFEAEVPDGYQLHNREALRAKYARK